MRYSNKIILKNINNISYYKGKKYPQIPLSEDDVYVITTIGDRLDILANTYYNDPTLWWVISMANSNVLKTDSLFIIPGTQIRIPTNLGNILQQYENINRI